jgi:pimeloyl-ACP methyl ester carboxylesterase
LIREGSPVTLIVVLAIAVGIWLGSFAVEALRRPPHPPERLRWAPDTPISYVDVGGMKFRYIKTGQGPTVVLLHTLRTQLDLFESVVPDLATRFTVYAPDFPGHGYSDIPKATYDADFFAASIEGFLEILDLRDVTLAGVSIGGAVALILAGRRNPRVARVVAINPYDYAKGRGIARSGLAGWLTAMTARLPVLGETYNRLRSFPIVRAVFLGGVADREGFPPALLREMYDVGNRRGHSRAFVKLLRRAASWEQATSTYGAIQIPVRLVWGDHDWSTLSEREHDGRLLHDVEMFTIERGGHFLPLDRPDAVMQQIIQIATTTA